MTWSFYLTVDQKYHEDDGGRVFSGCGSRMN